MSQITRKKIKKEKMLQNPIQRFKSPRISMVIVVGSDCFFTFRLQIKTEEPHFCPPPLFSFKHPNPKHSPFPSYMLTCVANIPSLCPLNHSHTPTTHSGTLHNFLERRTKLSSLCSRNLVLQRDPKGFGPVFESK